MLHRPELETWSDSKMKVLAKIIKSVNLYFQKYATRKEEKFSSVDINIEKDYYNNNDIHELKLWVILKPVPRTPIIKLSKVFHLPSLTSTPNMTTAVSSKAVVPAYRTMLRPYCLRRL